MNLTYLYCITCLLCVVTSCVEPPPQFRFCVENTSISNTAPILADATLDSAILLFEHNQMDYSNLIINNFTQSSDGNYHIFCYQFVNGAKVFFKENIYHFNDKGDCFFMSGDSIDKSQLNTTPDVRDLNDLVSVFLNGVSHDSNYSGRVDSIACGCFSTQFGLIYDYDLGDYKKTWCIKPLNRNYPVMYISDEMLYSIWYDSGYRPIEKFSQ